MILTHNDCLLFFVKILKKKSSYLSTSRGIGTLIKMNEIDIIISV